MRKGKRKWEKGRESQEEKTGRGWKRQVDRRRACVGGKAGSEAGGREADWREVGRQVGRWRLGPELTCDGRLNIDHGLLLAEERGALVDDAEGGGLIDAALQDEVFLERLELWLACLRVEHLDTC